LCPCEVCAVFGVSGPVVAGVVESVIAGAVVVAACWACLGAGDVVLRLLARRCCHTVVNQVRNPRLSRGRLEMIFTGVAGSRVIARQPNSAPVRLGVSGFPLFRLLRTAMIYLDGPLLGLKLCSTVVRWLSRPRRSTVGSRPSLDSHRTTAQTGLYERGGVGETHPLSCAVSHGTRTPVRGLHRATSRRPIAHLTCVAVKVSRHRRTP
jgi:hypothetical protein